MKSGNYAVYPEYSDAIKPMKIYDSSRNGWNRRVFNKIEAEKGTLIRLNEETGEITIQPGSYHISVFSTVFYNQAVIVSTPKQSAEIENIHPGYCRLYAKTNQAYLSTGSISNNDYLTPGLSDLFIEFKKTTKLVIDHQVGGSEEKIKDVYLRVGGDETSTGSTTFLPEFALNGFKEKGIKNSEDSG